MKNQKMTYRAAIRELRIIKKMHAPYGDEAIDLAISTLKYFDDLVNKSKKRKSKVGIYEEAPNREWRNL